VDTYPNDSTLITWKSCISKKVTRVGHPYAIVSKKVYTCPTGKVVNKRYNGKDFHGKGQFETFVHMYNVTTEGNLSPRSPWLNLR
jgi:hypothetical protein